MKILKFDFLKLNGTTLTDKVMDSVRAEVIKQGWDDINPPDVVLKDPFGVRTNVAIFCKLLYFLKIFSLHL